MDISTTLDQISKPASPMTLLKDVYATQAAGSAAKQAATEAEASAAALKEKNHIRDVVANKKADYMSPDGSVNYPKLNALLSTGAPTQTPEFMRVMHEADNAYYTVRRAAAGLSAEQAGRAAQLFYSVKDQPVEYVKQAMDGVAKQNPDYAQQLGLIWKYQLEPYAKDPGQFAQAIKNVGDFFQAIPAQKEQSTPSAYPINTGNESYAVNMKPGARVNGTEVGQGGEIPGTRASVYPSRAMGVDANGIPVLLEGNQEGITARGMATETPPSAPPPSPFADQQQSAPEQPLTQNPNGTPPATFGVTKGMTYEQFNDIFNELQAKGDYVGQQRLGAAFNALHPTQNGQRNATPPVRNAPTQATRSTPAYAPPGMSQADMQKEQASVGEAVEANRSSTVLHQSANEVLSILDEAKAKGGVANTGYWADTVRKLGSNPFSPVFGGYAENADVLRHNIQQQTANLAQSAGMSTDSGRALAADLAGSIENTPEGLRKIVMQNDALVTAGSYYAKGLQEASKGGAAAIRAFKSEWPSKVDITGIELHNALARKNKGDVAGIVEKLGGKDSERYKKALDFIRYARTNFGE